MKVFLNSMCDPQLVYQRPLCILSCLWDGAYKRTLVANQKVSHVVAAVVFHFHYMSFTTCSNS